MGDGGMDTPAFGKSVRSFAEALGSLEKEVEVIFERARTESAGGMMKYLKGLLGSGPLGIDLGGLLRFSARTDTPVMGRALARSLGLADERALDAVREDVREIMEQVARLREREVALAGGLSQIRARSARFDEALAGLARVQGKYVARLDAQAIRADDIERQTAKRDDHITRLIRDTASQRAELERVVGEVAARPADAQVDAADTRDAEATRKRLEQVECQLVEVKKLEKTRAEGVIDTLESVRDRMGKLEGRVIEMTREARAKGGRLDALARHVAGVETRVSTALGRGGKPVVTVATDIDQPIQAAG
ncbi:MAG: hypothetical protein E4H03_04850 [Myxococcales bacterium]|jgi:chromosome segregation ATPase|nr:MAG: hypothetical protein E4H03_04850 [Myxococcales bacterium]